MKTVPTGLAAAHASPVQRPGYLVEVHFSTVRRWSTQGAQLFGGHVWTDVDLQVQGLQVLPFSVSGTLALGNFDDGIGTAVLTEGVKDRLIQIYGFDAAAPTDAVWLCSAVGASAQVGTRDVRISLRDPSEFIASPRTYVNAAAGFRHLLPSGTVLRINGIDMRLERRT
jgi:hypothetical protein